MSRKVQYPPRTAVRLFRMAALLVSFSALGAPQMVSSAPTAANMWRSMTESDLSAAVKVIKTQYISAVYPDPAAFSDRLNADLQTARQEASQVIDYGGYYATLKHFANGLDDEHAGIRLTLAQTALQWPGFVLQYSNGKYRTAVSHENNVKTGLVVTSCDGHSIDDWIGKLVPYSGGHPGLESTKATAALALLVDQGNPFIKRPSICVIGGQPVPLTWTRLYYPDFIDWVQPLRGREDRTVAVSPFGTDSAWVRIGNFEPGTPSEVAAFRDIVAVAPSLRTKRMVVLDVRQNGGGPYDWMMEFLRAFYGPTYANYYARARLSIRPVYRATPQILAQYRESDAEDRKLGDVTDKATDSGATAGVGAALATGSSVYVAPRADGSAPPEGPPPPNPVTARVVVLTDFGCASVCIGFVDELKRFPGVEQIGTDTFVDSRTGTPHYEPLPSGNGEVFVATMTRDGRKRGDNVPQHPTLSFPGDIADTAAVRRWVATLASK